MTTEIVEIVPSFVPRKIPVTIVSVFLLFSFLLSFFFLLFIGTQIRYLNFFFFHADNCPFRAIERQRKSLEREKEEKEARSIINWEQKKRRRGDRCKKMQAEKRAEEEKDSRAHYPPEGYLQEERKEGRKEGRRRHVFAPRWKRAAARNINIAIIPAISPAKRGARVSPPFSLPWKERERERDTFSRQWERRNETKRSGTPLGHQYPRYDAPKIKSNRGRCAAMPAALKQHGKGKIRGRVSPKSG